MTTEIVETGITLLEISKSAAFNRTFVPAGGEAKWFKDELGQLWVKFSTTKAGDQPPLQHVVPASRVVEVQYQK